MIVWISLNHKTEQESPSKNKWDYQYDYVQ